MMRLAKALELLGRTLHESMSEAEAAPIMVAFGKAWIDNIHAPDHAKRFNETVPDLVDQAWRFIHAEVQSRLEESPK